MTFSLASACPRLERCRNMKYAVPGKQLSAQMEACPNF